MEANIKFNCTVICIIEILISCKIKFVKNLKYLLINQLQHQIFVMQYQKMVFMFPVVEPGKPAWHKIQEEFGPDVFLDTKHLDRTKLGDLIFNNVEKRKKLNAITHPDIYKEIYWQTIKYFLQGHPFIVMDLPLLFETGHMLNYLYKIIVVTWYVFWILIGTITNEVFLKNVIKIYITL